MEPDITLQIIVTFQNNCLELDFHCAMIIYGMLEPFRCHYSYLVGKRTVSSSQAIIVLSRTFTIDE